MLRSARFTTVTVMSFVVASLLTSMVIAQQPAAAVSANRASAASPQQDESLAERLKTRFDSAIRSFGAGRPVAAELDLRDAANLVGEQVKKLSDKKGRQRLSDTARDLKSIADRIRNRKVLKTQELREELARVHLGLAMHHAVECQHCLKHGDTTRPVDRSRLAAGLDSGLLHFEEAARLTGRKLNKAAKHGLMQSRDTVELIAEGSRDTVADSGRAVSWLTRELKDMVRDGRIAAGVGVGFEETDLAPSLIK